MPTETPQQYTARLLSYTEGHDALSLMRTTPIRLAQIMGGRSIERLRQRPASDRWSPAEIVTHLADAEVVGAWRFRSVLATNEVPLQEFDQNVWAEAFKYEQGDPWLSLEMFSALRRSTVALLERVDRSRFENVGVHAERGRESVTHLIRLYAGHDVNHLRQLETLLA